MPSVLRKVSQAKWLLTISVIFAFGGAVSAQLGRGQDDDLVDLVRRREKVEMQRVEFGIRERMREAQQLTQSAPAKAVEKLKDALVQLENETILPKERREALRRMLNDRLQIAEAKAAHVAVKRKEQTKPVQAANKKASEVPKPADAEDPKQSLITIRELQKDGKFEDAGREASQFADRRPPSPTTEASARTTQAADDILKARKVKNERERHLVGAFRDLENSVTAPAGDLEFPKDWKERTKGRTAAVQLTAKEKAILQALNATISVNFKDTKLEDVIEYLQTATGQPILLDKEALKDVEASYDTPISIRVKGVTVRTVLRRILADIGMNYIIRDEAILVTSAQKARDIMITRRYYVGDLLANMGVLGAVNPIPPVVSPLTGVGGVPIVPIVPYNFGVVSPLLNPQAAQNLQAQQNAVQLKQTIDQLRDMIIDSVDSKSWQINGGAGTITFHLPTMSFIIRQSAEVHAMLGAGLAK
jgi:hypothetical protein